MTPAGVQTVGHMVYILRMTGRLTYNQRNQLTTVLEALWLDNAVCVAPINRLGMLTDYANPAEKLIADPSQDVVYGPGDSAPTPIRAILITRRTGRVDDGLATRDVSVIRGLSTREGRAITAGCGTCARQII